MNLLKYIDLGVVGYETVTTFMGLIAAKQVLSAGQIVTAVTPLVTTIQVTFNVVIPAPLVSEIAATTADAINKYVFGK